MNTVYLSILLIAYFLTTFYLFSSPGILDRYALRYIFLLYVPIFRDVIARIDPIQGPVTLYSD